MKILHVLQNYEPSKGGTQFLFKNVSERMFLNFNDKVEVYTTNSYFDPGSRLFTKIPNEIEIINNVVIRRFSFFRFHRVFVKLLNKIAFKISGRTFENLSKFRLGPWSPNLHNAIYRTNCDVICASSSQYAYMDYPIYRGLVSSGKPFVMMGAIHFDDENRISVPKYILKRIAASEKYIANTKFEKDCLIKLGIEPNKINVIGCGVNLGDFGITPKNNARSKLGLENSDFVIGYVGRFAVNKDIFTLLSAFSKNCKDNWKLILAGGSNSYLYEIQKVVNSTFYSIADKIHLIVDFDDLKKEEIYSSLDVFVSPSYSESFGIVFLEAWASKLPVIGTDIGAIKSVITDGQDGRLFEARNAIQLSKLLLFYYENIQIRLLHGISGYNKLIQHNSWDIIAEKYRNTYIEAISIFNNKNRCVE